MKNWFLLFFLLPLFSIAQNKSNSVVESDFFSINLPDLWKSSNDEGIYNLYPDNQIGAITISGYDNLNLSDAEMKQFVLNLYGRKDSTEAVIAKFVRGATEYHYDFVDETEKIQWQTKVIKKNNIIYIVSLLCPTKYWSGNYKILFLETYNSFKLKK